jgi:hypothetical protein
VASLRITSGPALGVVVPVPAGGVIIGRESTGIPELARDTAISRRHAEVGQTSAGDLYVRDLDSTNGTYVDGFEINGLHILRPGERLQIGDTTLELAEAPSPQETLLHPPMSRRTSGRVEIRGSIHADRGGVAAARDIYGGVHTRNEFDASGWGLLLRTRGIARVLVITGLIISLAGVASWGYPIVKFISDGAASATSQSGGTRFEALQECQEKFSGSELQRCIAQAQDESFRAAQASQPDFEAKPWLPLGAVLVLVGAVVTTAGLFSARRDD